MRTWQGEIKVCTTDDANEACKSYEWNGLGIMVNVIKMFVSYVEGSVQV